MRIGIVAPSCTLDGDIAARVTVLAADAFPAVELVFDAQCHLSSGHFAGSDDARVDAFVRMANDPAIDAVWFGRGGYGANRIAPRALPQLTAVARNKAYLGYSDAGFLLAGLYKNRIGQVAHGPMPADIKRHGGDAAILRALKWLINRDAPNLLPLERSGALNIVPPISGGSRKCAAFNLTVFSQLLGTSLEPDLSDHVLMLEDVAEYMYRIDRGLFHITSNANVRQVAGIMLGRCSQIPENEPDFGMDEDDVIRHWCSVAGIPYLGRADIGHDVDNKVVAFG
jgi:muramoyltetrapeptide carboxypeptidase